MCVPVKIPALWILLHTRVRHSFSHSSRKRFLLQAVQSTTRPPKRSLPRCCSGCPTMTRWQGNDGGKNPPSLAGNLEGRAKSAELKIDRQPADIFRKQPPASMRDISQMSLLNLEALVGFLTWLTSCKESGKVALKPGHLSWDAGMRVAEDQVMKYEGIPRARLKMNPLNCGTYRPNRERQLSSIFTNSGSCKSSGECCASISMVLKPKICQL